MNDQDSLLDNFCEGEPIWDYQLAWNATRPTFTRCFQKTLPIWLPSLFLLFFAPLETYLTLRSADYANRCIHSIPWNRYNVGRLVLVGLTVALNGVQFARDMRYFVVPDVLHHVNMADLTYSLLNCFTFTLFGFLVYLHRKHGQHTSGVAWVFTFLALIFLLPVLYMHSLYASDSADLPDPARLGLKQWSTFEFATFMGHFTLVCALFLLTCFADYRLPVKRKDSGLEMMNGNAKNGAAGQAGAQVNGDLPEAWPLVEKEPPKEGGEPSLVGENPEMRASFISQLSYWWFNELCITGFKKSLTLADLWSLTPDYESINLAPKFDQAWRRQTLPKAATQPPPPPTTTSPPPADDMPQVDFVLLDEPSSSSVAKPKKAGVISALWTVFGLPFLGGAFFKLTHDMLQFVNPLLLKVFIAFVGAPVASEPIWHGFIIATGFFFVSTVQSFMINVYFHYMFSVGMQVRSVLISAIYRKSLGLSNDARRETTTGEVVNLMSVDAQRFVDLLPFVNLIWSAPLQIILTIYFLWHELGPSVLAGLLVMVLLIPVNGWISTYQRRLQIKQMKKKDERVKVTGEILNGMRVIKLYGWEVPFIGRVSAIRDKEIALLKNISYIGAVTSFIWTSAPFLVSFVTFAIYVLASDENILDAQKAFVSLALFNLLRFPLTMLPMMITSVVTASVSVKRLNKFLNSSQLDAYVSRDESPDAITIEGGIFAWEGPKKDKEEKKKDKEVSLTETDGVTEITDLPTTVTVNGDPPGPKKTTITLNGIDLKVSKGTLVGIVGPVGSGKSSLLSAILGDMERLGGRVNVAKDESVAYVSQQAWIRNATLRENILFGAEFDKARYDSVIDMCALKPDIAVLPGGDQTEIGEKGINLSGGQKQRVAIARACYQPASIVLLDDPLSAVDSHVAKHIFSKVLSSSTGFLKDRTRVLVTNGISMLPEVDQIVVIVGGHISEAGTYEQLIAANGKFAEFLREHANEKPEGEADQTADGSIEHSGQRNNSVSSDASKSATLNRQKSVKEEAETQKLIEAERAETGNVKWSIYLHYFRSLTFLWLSIMLSGFVAMQVLSVGSSVWLAIWSNDNSGTEDKFADIAASNGTYTLSDSDRERRNMRLIVYGVFGGLQAFFVFVGAISMAKGTVNSSLTMHSSLLYRIMRSPMSFFDTTPQGRIMNRFSKDVDTVDSTLPHTIRGWMLCFLQVLSTFILIGYQVPVFMLVAVPILVVYYFIQKFYVSTSRQLKRLESITRSPIYSHFGETLSGVHTIRAYAATTRFIDDSNRIVDTNQRCNYSSVIANRWLALRLEFCGNLIVFFSAVFAVSSRESFQAAPGFIGLIMTYSLSVTQTLNWLVRMTSEMETNVVSVERIGEYCENETEKEWTRIVNAEPVIPEGWPNKGEINFDQYAVRYREGLDLVLNGISLHVQPGEKVGIVGRTGAGKSSLTLALFRLLESASGRIVIDGIDIAAIGLHELRSKLSIIPQDPVLFSGTIRSNLDPFAVYSDAQLWTALEHCHLKEYIVSQEAGLDYLVAENGDNLSVGQRQLICLGRALLRKTRILVLDEATAAIDLSTDGLIQETIRQEFADCTVLTIAHRLNTILDSTRVLVLDQGKVAEFDSPATLLADRRSRFYALAKDARLV